MNKIILVGNLVDKPTFATTSNGNDVCKFVIAVNNEYKNADGEREAQYFNIIAWKGLAKLCNEYLDKGRKVLVDGKAQNRKYETDEGEKKYVFEVIANEVEFLGGKEKK